MCRAQSTLSTILLFLFAFSLFSIPADGIAATENSGSINKPPKYRLRQPSYGKHQNRQSFVEIGGGLGVWHQSNEPQMQASGMPLHLLAEYGSIGSPISYGIGVNRGSRYELEGFILSNDYTFAQIKFDALSLITVIPESFSAYALLGAIYWQSQLDDQRINPQVISENPLEGDNGPGLMAGVGASYRWKNLGLHTQLTYFHGQAEYYAGADEPLDVRTGNTQLNLIRSYRISFGDAKLACPVYQ